MLMAWVSGSNIAGKGRRYRGIIFGNATSSGPNWRRGRLNLSTFCRFRDFLCCFQSPPPTARYHFGPHPGIVGDGNMSGRGHISGNPSDNEPHFQIKSTDSSSGSSIFLHPSASLVFRLLSIGPVIFHFAAYLGSVGDGNSPGRQDDDGGRSYLGTQKSNGRNSQIKSTDSRYFPPFAASDSFRLISPSSVFFHFCPHQGSVGDGNMSGREADDFGSPYLEPHMP